MKTRILTKVNDEKGSTTATVVWGLNHLNQKRQFAYDGRYWLYQPTTQTAFIRVNATDVPQTVVEIMAKETKLTAERLREEPQQEEEQPVTASMTITEPTHLMIEPHGEILCTIRPTPDGRGVIIDLDYEPATYHITDNPVTSLEIKLK